MRAVDHRRWPSDVRWIDALWVLFWLANLGAMLLLPTWETVPFHFIWVSLTLLYGFRVWGIRPTLTILALVVVTTGVVIGIAIGWGAQPPDELTEVPLMSAMFLAMVWHARRRLVAMEETERVSKTNLRLLEREQRFVQDASHELRTPITVALGHAELIQRDAVQESVQHDAAVITEELMRLRRLADRLLILAGAEEPGFLHATPLELEGFLVQTAQRWAATPRKWRLASAEEATVLADPDRLAVALDALIENAVKHTKEDDAIELATYRRDGAAVVSIQDTGTGILSEDLDRIFDRFARADPGRSRRTGGAGLGLAIVRAIVEAHGGSIDVESSVGQGTRFEISLPVANGSSRTSLEGSDSAAV
jgi:signal transduction histidine kinase